MPMPGLLAVPRPSSVEAHVSQYADRRANAVAIVSADPLLAALVGAAVELYGYRAEFPRDDEAPTDTLRRARPLYMLIDAKDLRAGDGSLLGRSLMSGVGVFAFGTAGEIDSLGPLLLKFETQAIVFPRDLEALPSILTRRAPARDTRVLE